MNKIVLSYGAGTNSKAIACELVMTNKPLDAIVFADTGGERPDIYADIEKFSEWLVMMNYPQIITIRRSPAKVGNTVANTLEEECLLRNQLPSIAYGFKSCSDKWKLQPFKKWLKQMGWHDVTVLVGFDADEAHRAERGDQHDEGYTKQYPLIEWGWGREECIAAINRAGVSQPGKSSCFFCPSSKSHEILSLPDNLKSRALAIESGADLTVIKGLGRNFAWRDIIRYDEAQLKLFDSRIEAPCGCYK